MYLTSFRRDLVAANEELLDVDCAAHKIGGWRALTQHGLDPALVEGLLMQLWVSPAGLN